MKMKPLSLTYCLHDEIAFYWDYTIILLLGGKSLQLRDRMTNVGDIPYF